MLDDLLERADWPLEEERQIRALAERAQTHPLFRALDTPARLSVFAEHHVFAVWDFMALLHSVRLGICAGDVRWTPPTDKCSTRLIYEILIEEEAGPSFDGEHRSHFESYLLAMSALGASTCGVAAFLAAVRAGAEPEAVIDAHAPGPAAAFVKRTLECARATLPERVAALAVARERLIPAMFPVLGRFVAPLEGRADLRPFRYYLERHVAVDGTEHGPATGELVARHARGDVRAARAAREALAARVALWDGILVALDEATALQRAASSLMD